MTTNLETLIQEAQEQAPDFKEEWIASFAKSCFAAGEESGFIKGVLVGREAAVSEIEQNEVSFDGNYHLIGDKELEAARTNKSTRDDFPNKPFSEWSAAERA